MSGTHKQDKLRVVPIELSDANSLVERLHRHHKPVIRHRFSLGVLNENGVLVGAAIAGRPVARMTESYEVLEITRLVTDGTPNACSALYAAMARAAQAMGYVRVQTFIMESEHGTSLKAAGWMQDEIKSNGGSWVRDSRPDRREDQPMCAKVRWSRTVNPPIGKTELRCYSVVCPGCREHGEVRLVPQKTIETLRENGRMWACVACCGRYSYEELVDG